jgi:hypothetical protein
MLFFSNHHNLTFLTLAQINKIKHFLEGGRIGGGRGKEFMYNNKQ